MGRFSFSFLKNSRFRFGLAFRAQAQKRRYHFAHAGVDRLAWLQRYRVEIDLVGNGEEVRNFRVIENAEVTISKDVAAKIT